jgi:hypothetical protein
MAGMVRLLLVEYDVCAWSSGALNARIGTRIPRVQLLLFIETSKMGHACESRQVLRGGEGVKC